MDQKYIEDQHIVARYLADQLSDSEREAFEAFCAGHPETYRELEATARFKVGLARLAESKQLEPALAREPAGASFLMRHAAALGGVAIGVALLASVVYLSRVPVMGVSVAEVSGRFRPALPVVVTPDLERRRDSTEFDQRIELPTHTAAIELRVLPDVEGAARYRATIARETPAGEEQVASVAGLVPDETHFVTLFVSSAKLLPGAYSLVVVPEESGQEPATRFRLEMAAAPQ